MSDISQEEKNRILRERRQAKMAKGQASQRLNTILSQGSSFKVEETLTLDKNDKPSSSTPEPSHAASVSSSVSTSVPIADQDPEIQDISSLSAPEPDMDAIFQSVFGQANSSQQSGAFDSQGQGQPQDPFAEMMKNMLQGTDGITGPNSPLGEMDVPALSPEQKYATEMAAYSAFQHKAWRMRLLAVRYSLILAMFAYYYTVSNGFTASSDPVVRVMGVDHRGRDFFRLFTALEILFTSSYYIIGSRHQWFAHASQTNLISKAISMGLMFLPQLQQVKPIFDKVLAYYTLLGMVVGDVSLVIILFGLFSR